MLEILSVLDPVKKNVVRFFEKFYHKGHTCLVFEMLDRCLYQLLEERDWKPLSLCEIRPITHQLLTAFDALKGIGVVHSDLKPDNIMLANHDTEPFRVKLIDFGLSFATREEARGMSIQPLGYRAPEVILGLPVSEAIDMWSLGCLLGFLYLAEHPFAINCEYQSMKGIVDVLGQPADHLLSAGDYTHKFFKANQHWDNPRWWMKTPREYQLGTGIEPETWKSALRSLDDLMTHDPETQESIELVDQRAFVSLLKSLLNTDPEKRITPGKALEHPFATMAHLMGDIETSLYVEDCLEKMAVLPMDDLDEDLSPDNEAEEEPRVEEPSATPPPNDAGSAVFRSCDGIKNTPHSSEGLEAAAETDAAGSAVEELAVSRGQASPADGEAQVEPRGEEPSATPPPADAGSAVIRSCDGIKNTPNSSEGQEADVKTDAAGSAEQELAVSQCPSSPAEETSAKDGSPDEGPPARVKESPLKRIKKFFGRAIRTLFKMKKK
ncbi:homeodomain-interacting protein kinase 1-like [Xiphias gladius]|uniref:homeodomain-interacting protein kinase 1-like n=1 Tax=Xiphias gladius TaxID=8245 RepID=UPI001A98B308|nr:homeodomain-interacting protein kinase 1-like [Xiphias gladius]XP_039979247.1 homeodomain-interacting protein kinase 1-like [Xiphias gladius]